VGWQVPAWMNESRTNVSIQIPTIGGVDLDSSDDDDDDSERRFHKNDSPKTKVLTREQVTSCVPSRRWHPHTAARIVGSARTRCARSENG
jgi:hypothetical protein